MIYYCNKKTVTIEAKVDESIIVGFVIKVVRLRYILTTIYING